MKKLNQATLDKIVNQTISRSIINGCVFHTVSVDNSINLTSAAGNIAPDSQYYIASINKFLISAITHRFSREKKLNLSDKISAYLSGEIMEGLLIYRDKDYSNDITINHLLSHTSGLPCYLIDKRPDGKKNMDLILNGDDQSWPFDKVVSEVKKMRSKFQPGSKRKANYSETNFRLLDKILETITQKSIKELLSALFEELEMKDTFVLPSISAGNCAPIYFKQNLIKLEEYWKSTNHDVASTVYDQMVFLRAFFEGHFLPKEKISELEIWNNIFFPFKYGLGIQKFYVPRVLSPFKAVPAIIGHCGSVGSVAFFVPEKQVYITGTVNQTSNPNIVFQTIIKIINH
jgi:CubicO group peptidase (beta-lactamase class C family)